MSAIHQGGRTHYRGKLTAVTWYGRRVDGYGITAMTAYRTEKGARRDLARQLRCSEDLIQLCPEGGSFTEPLEMDSLPVWELVSAGDVWPPPPPRLKMTSRGCAMPRIRHRRRVVVFAKTSSEARDILIDCFRKQWRDAPVLSPEQIVLKSISREETRSEFPTRTDKVTRGEGHIWSW